MANTIKWIILSIVSGIAAIFLYTTIDSEWASRTNMSIWMTILFFASATVAIVCVFNAVETNDKTQEEDKPEKPPVSREAPKAMDIKKIGRMTS